MSSNAVIFVIGLCVTLITMGAVLLIARGEEDTVLITGGLAAGDSIVMEPLQGVAPGMPVRPRPFQAGGGR